MLDTLIIGQGLAGSLLAIKLINLGQKVLVIDDNHKTSSTKIAAGIMNPIIGKRLVKLWPSKRDEDFAINYYRTIEKKLGSPCLNRYNLIRFLDDKTVYEKRLRDPAYRSIIKYCNPKAFQSICNIGYAQFQCFPVYQVDTKKLLLKAKQYLQKNSTYIQSDVSYKDIVATPYGVSWKSYQAKSAIFCEGSRGQKNPYFKHLEFENALGEILEIECSGLTDKTILNHGKWLCPIGKGLFKYGATSYWKASNQAYIDSTHLLKNSLRKFLKHPFTLKDISSGIRPVLKNRTPFSGWNATLPIGMINGLGGQGISLAPKIINTFCNTHSEYRAASR